MPSEPTAEQLELRRKGRQRLVGAITLALLAVVFLPMVLDPEPRRERAEPVLAIPPRDNAPPLPPSTQAPAQSAPAAVPAAAPLPPMADGKPGSTTPAPAPEAKVTEAKAPPPKPAVAVQKSDAPRLEGFAVQVGAFKDEARLRQAREKLVAAGIAHYIERQPDFTRLRAGPFPTREAAESALAGLKRAGLDGRVVPLP